MDLPLDERKTPTERAAKQKIDEFTEFRNGNQNTA
jgi:hypothetical protein